MYDDEEEFAPFVQQVHTGKTTGANGGDISKGKLLVSLVLGFYVLIAIGRFFVFGNPLVLVIEAAVYVFLWRGVVWLRYFQLLGAIWNLATVYGFYTLLYIIFGMGLALPVMILAVPSLYAAYVFCFSPSGKAFLDYQKANY